MGCGRACAAQANPIALLHTFERTLQRPHEDDSVSAQTTGGLLAEMSCVRWLMGCAGPRWWVARSCCYCCCCHWSQKDWGLKTPQIL
jgi:hypothetical protein